jgi:hypothetical protein
VDLTVGVEHPVEAALGTDMEAPIRQHRHDLPWRQCGEFRLVAGEEDPLAFLFAEAVRDQAWAAFAAIVTIAITDQGLPPALESAQADADLAAGADQARTRCMSLSDQLDRLEAMSGAGQPSASSPQ